jgi:lia operon protein LiaG
MRVPILVTLAFLTPAAMTAQQAERFTVSGDEIAIYNLAGSVTIEPGSGAATVLVTRAGPGAARLSIAKGELDGRGTLRILYPSDRIVYPAMGKGSSTDLKVREDGTFSDGDFYHRHDDDEDDDRHDHYESGRRVTIVGAGDGLEASADLRIQLPAGRRAWVYLAVGKVAVANIDGELSIDAHNAPVNATGTRGALSIDVGSGPVSVTGARGTLSVDTGSGPVEVSRFEGKELTVDTGSGDVTASEVKSDGLSIDTAVSAPEITVETGSGGITADLRTNPTALSVETGSGNIRITAPQTLGAEVDIETSSGEVESDFPLQVTRHSREHLVGTIGNGRGKIQIETGSGDVRLLRKTS